MGTQFLRGDLYRADLGEGIGYEQSGLCSVVVVQNDTGNLHSPNIIVAALSRGLGTRRKNPVQCPLRSVDAAAYADLGQLRTVDKSRLKDRLGHLSQGDIDGIDRALRISLGLEPGFRRDSMLLTLCGPCAGQFFYNPHYKICRADPGQMEMDVCTLCNFRRGFDYVVQRRQRDDRG